MSASQEPVVFVCEHGNVKSLMAALYFNEIAQKRGLRVRAVSRASGSGGAPVPGPIAAGLKGEGFDVSTFTSTAVRAADVDSARRIVTIGTELPDGVQAAAGLRERWDDVPPATVDFAAARTALRARVSALIDELQERDH